jgi:multidrug efflux system membrane fusion protein
MNDESRSPFDPAQGADSGTLTPKHKLFVGRRLLLVIAVVLALILLAWLLTPKSGQPRGGRQSGTGPMPVVAATAQIGDMPIILNGLGTVTPIATVTVQSQISGQITQIAFKEGQLVKAGDFLLQIDPRPYQVALEQAEGALVRDQALLANARVDLTRYDTLNKEDSIAEQQLATQKALVIQDEGTVKTDQGQIDAAKLNLIYCHITTPVGGRVGLQQVNLGNYVTPDEPNGLVVVTQLTPITVVFTLAEDQIPDVVKQLHANQTLSVTAYDRSHTTRLATGTLLAIDSQIDTTTGTLKLKASFANQDESLFPNQFVNVDLLINTLHGATLVPQAAIQRGAPGTYVYLINADQTVDAQKVTLGAGDATNIVVTQGIAVGQRVVIDGADKLKDGAKVSVRQAGATPAASTPPAQSKGRRPKGGTTPTRTSGTNPS